MFQACNGKSFSLEASLRDVRTVAEQDCFDRNDPVQVQLLGAINHTHPAASNKSQNLVAGNRIEWVLHRVNDVNVRAGKQSATNGKLTDGDSLRLCLLVKFIGNRRGQQLGRNRDLKKRLIVSLAGVDHSRLVVGSGRVAEVRRGT